MASPSERPGVLFVCVANSCRSQMAEAVAKSLAGGRWEIWSAGSHPMGQVHPTAIQLMNEIGLEMSSHRSKGVDAVPDRQWDYVVSMGCGDRCPPVSATHRLDWDTPDPVGLPIEEARTIRDQIVQRVRDLLTSERTSEPPRA